MQMSDDNSSDLQTPQKVKSSNTCTMPTVEKSVKPKVCIYWMWVITFFIWSSGLWASMGVSSIGTDILLLFGFLVFGDSTSKLGRIGCFGAGTNEIKKIQLVSQLIVCTMRRMRNISVSLARQAFCTWVLGLLAFMYCWFCYSGLYPLWTVGTRTL